MKGSSAPEEVELLRGGDRVAPKEPERGEFVGEQSFALRTGDHAS